MTRRALLFVIMLAQAGCSTRVPAPAPTSFCDHTDFDLSDKFAANYSLTYIKKPDQFHANYSYWNLCGPAWTRGGASLAYSPSDLDLMFPKAEINLNQSKP